MYISRAPLEVLSQRRNILMIVSGDYLFFDIIGEFLFDVRLNMLQNGSNRYLVKTVKRSQVRHSVVLYLPILKTFYLDWLLFPKTIVQSYKLVKFVARTLRQQLSQVKQPNIGTGRVLHMENRETQQPMRKSELAAESLMLIIAGAYTQFIYNTTRVVADSIAINLGADTSSTTLCAILFYLSRYEDACARLTKEIREKFPTRSSVRLGSALSSCTYLHACIEESLRLSPVVGGAIYRTVLPPGLLINDPDLFIPPGISVATGIYALHHNAEYFPDPTSWRPERWLEAETSAEDLARSRIAFNAFSHGPATCLGQDVAMAELMLVVASLIAAFDFEVADGEIGRLGEGREDGPEGRRNPKEFQLYDHITSDKMGPALKFRFAAGRCPG